MVGCDCEDRSHQQLNQKIKSHLHGERLERRHRDPSAVEALSGLKPRECCQIREEYVINLCSVR